MQNQPINQRSGIALVMVLGVLSLMVLMAVSFAISMRTERVAAGNQLDTVRARHLARVGLVRAMDQLYRECGRDLPDSNLVYQEWAVTNSYTLDPTNAPPVDLLKGSASNFVPRSLWDAAVAANDTNSPNSSNYWISIISDVKETNSNYGTTNLIGRVAFMILNCSGLLDANFAGGAERGCGTNPVEIALTSLPEMSVAYTPILTNRADWKRFETLEELNELAGYESENFFIYSRAPPGYYTNNSPLLVGTQVNLGGDFDDLVDRKQQIINAFELSGFSVKHAGILFTNLINYVDIGRIPIDDAKAPAMGTPATKPVPMINEVVVECEVNNSGTNFTVGQKYLYVELWAPFVEFDPISYSVEVSGGFAAGMPGDLHGDKFTPSPPPAEQFSARTIKHFKIPINVPIPPFTSMNNEVVMVVTNLEASVFRHAGAGHEEVDRFTSPALYWVATNVCPNVKNLVRFSMECVDPRINWDPNDLNQWVWTNMPSLDQINGCTSNFWKNTVGCDTNDEMYVACSNALHSVGELGYLVYSNWSTIKLCGSGADPVLDYFAIETNCGDFVTNVVWRGRVNPNTTNREVLAAVFSEMPADEYPEQAGPTRLDWTQAVDVADFIIENRPYTNLSDVCRLDWGNEEFIGIATNELQREAFIRNTAGLLSTRGQVYTILIEAQVASGGNIPKNPSRQRAVAVVWRDAWTGEMIVRYLKWLPD